MTDRDAFMQAIIDSPEDDSSRLVFADWLEDHGEQERAEFIRRQCELAKLSPDDDRWDGLARRERELWDQHGESWRQTLPKWARNKVAFRRGFPSAVPCTILQWLDHSSSIRRQTPVDSLELAHGEHGQLAGLCASSVLAGVTALSAWWLQSPEVRLLASSPHLGRLRVLSLYRGVAALGNRAEVGEILAGSANLPALTTLDLGCNEIRRSGAEAIARSAHLAGLTALDLNHNRIGNKGVRALAESPWLTRLTHLDVTANGFTDAGIEALAASARLTNLVYLNLGGGGDFSVEGLSERSAEALAASPALAKLHTLGLYLQSIGPGGMRALARSPYLTNLRVLHLFDNNIGDEGVRALAESPYLTRLTVLDLRRNGISDDGLRAMATSPNIAHLRRLAIRDNACSDAAIEELKEAQRRAGRRELRIGGLAPLTGFVHEEMAARFVPLAGDRPLHAHQR